MPRWTQNRHGEWQREQEPAWTDALWWFLAVLIPLAALVAVPLVKCGCNQ